MKSLLNICETLIYFFYFTLPHAEATKEFVEQQPDFEILRWIDATKELGRGMGGCIVGIRKSLSTLGITHSVVKTNNVKILRIRLRDRELNIIPLYIHAKVWEMEFGPVMEALENQEVPINNVILMGDLNIRIGALKQAVEPHRCVANTNGRQSHDKTIRGATEFLTFCTKNNLQILNGLTNGDSTGSYTYISTRGNSTIDIAAVSRNLMAAVVDFKVDKPEDGKPLHGSDHCPSASKSC